jgi:hypothetical protein
MRICELALRHFLTVLRPPDDATIWVGVEGQPAPAELIERFRDNKPMVHAWEGSLSKPHKWYCSMYMGRRGPTECILVVHGPPDHVLHHYHFSKQRGDWRLLKDEVAHLDG